MRFLLYILTLILFTGLMPASAQDEITLTLPVESIPVGETQVVFATIECPDSACNRLDITLRYDPTIILVNILNTGLGTYFSDRSDLRLLRNVIDNEEGSLRVTTSVSEKAPPSDSSIFLQLSITTLEIGISPLTVESLELGADVDSDAVAIEDGKITVTEGSPALQVLRPRSSRSGPGTHFEPAAMLQPDTPYEIVATSPDGAWFMLLLPNGQTGWIESGTRFVEATGDLLAIPIVELQPTVTLIPTNSPTSTATDTSPPSATHTGTATFTATLPPTVPPTATDTPSPTPSPTAVPTMTAMPTNTRTSIPTNTPSPTATLTPIVVLATANTNANVRYGDGTSFAIIDTLRRGETVKLIGVSSRGTGWFAIQLEDEAVGGELGWIADFVVTIAGHTDDLPLIDPPLASTVRRTQPPVQRSTVPPPPGQPTQPPAQPTAGDCSVFVAQSPRDGLANGITTFYWTLVPGADDYWVSIFNEQGENVRLASTGAVGTSLSIDTSATAIGPGGSFSWEVTAFQSGRVLCTTGRVHVPRAV